MKKFTTLILLLLLVVSCSKDEAKTDDTTPTPTTTTKTGTYTLDGQVFSCNCFADNTGYIFLMDKSNSKNSFSIYPMPSASSGTFQFGKSATSTTLPIGYLLESRAAYNGFGSEEGTITKTGAKSFTFQCSLWDPLKTTKYQISGSGSY
jgi:hypothetical protein